MISIDKFKDYGTIAKNWIRDNGKLHLIDAPASVASTSPIIAIVENAILDFPDETSLKSRLTALTFALLGIGTVLSRGRDLSKRLFKIKEGVSSEKTQWAHDILYTAGVLGIISPILYTIAGADPEQVRNGTLFAIGMSPITGGTMGYGIDLARDFTGVRPNDRVPSSLESLSQTLGKYSSYVPTLETMANQLSNRLGIAAEKVRGLKQSTKRKIAVGLVVASVGSIAGTYGLTDDTPTYEQSSSIEQVVEYSD